MQTKRAPQSHEYTECLECNQKIDGRIRLKNHLRKIHQLSFADYVIKHDHAGNHPTCLCGCGTLVTFQNGTHFAMLVHGHVTQELRDACGDRFRDKSLSDEHKKRLSDVLVGFYDSDDGKLRAEQRAEKLRQFHLSDKHDEWSRLQSARLKAFNASPAGTKKNEHLSKMLKDMLLTDEGREINLRRGKSVSRWAQSEEGRRFYTDRSIKRIDFYSTPEGKASILSSAEKIRQKNKLSIDVVMERLSVCDEKLEILTDVRNCYAGTNMDIVVKCRTCANVVNRKLSLVVLRPRCFICEPAEATISDEQLEVANEIKSWGFAVQISDRAIISPREIDVFIPNMNFCVEYNGLWWHNEANRPDKFHVMSKRKACEKAGLKLVTIFSDEWKERKEIVISMLRHRLGLSSRKEYARSCSLVNVTTKERQAFFTKNHIAGDVKAKVAFGLKDAHDELLAVMSLRVPLSAKHRDRFEVARFAVKNDVAVAGALSRLTKHALSICSAAGKIGIISYADARFSSKYGHEASGYTLIRETGPRFWWTDTRKRFDRFSVRAGALSENDEAILKNVQRIWGDGNFVFYADV